MLGFGRAVATTYARRVSARYRLSPRLLWVIGLVVIPLVIAAIGSGLSDRPGSPTEPGSAPATVVPSTTSSTPAISLAALSISRSGNNITVSGELPDDSARAELMTALRAALPAKVKIVDQTHINADIKALDFSKAAQLFKDSASITDFNLIASGDTVTLAGTAGSQDQKDAVAQDATSTWSNLNVVDRLTVSGTAPPAPAPATSSGAPPTSSGATPSPPPSPADPCTDLQAALNAATGGPIAFGSDGFSLTPDDEQILGKVADTLKACPNAHATVNGYADNSGTEAINIPLSNQRAQAVADFLVAHGVPSNELSVKGLGSINPVAPNDTPDGRAKNRRVEIVAS